MLEINSSSEIKLSGTDIYFDSERAVPFSFVTSANIEKLPRSEKIIATPETIRLLGKKVKGSNVLSSHYGNPFTLGNYSIELIPSGKMLGAAQVVVEKEGKKIIYAGGFKLKNTATAGYAELRRCDTLIVDCAYGAAKLIFPPPEVVMESIFEFVNRTLFEGSIPVILINPMGKAQDLIIFLGKRGIEMSLHPAMAKTLELYGDLGVKIPPYGGIKRKHFENRVLIVPLSYRDSAVIENLERKKVAVASGKAMGNGAFMRSAFRADVAFPLSCHWGYDEISEYLGISRPGKVIIRGEFNASLAEGLSKEGWNVTALKKPRQLALF
ncbi:MAG: hypothetical protein OXF23_02905 [Candidatus Dadabacteria bacterium]|nr:hypothetical protein [Candidatus Dadabacteria bacterium]MCY4262937.1 hypothetical protein [Candidatus Dadabacteria bacterium]